MVKQVTKKLSRDLETQISIKQVGFSFFDKMNLQGVLIRDQQQDTLLYAGRIRVNITDWFFLKNRIELKYLGLENAIVKLHRTDSVWNYRFIQDYFIPTTASQKKKSGIDFNLKNVDLKNVVFVQKDAWNGKNMMFSVGILRLDTKEGDFAKRIVQVNSLYLKDPIVAFFNYPKKNPISKAIIDETDPLPVNIDSLLQWNPAGWVINVAEMNIENGHFKNDNGNSEPLSHFDGKHVSISNINGQINSLHWRNDTITALVKLNAKERSGLNIRNFETNLRVHPEALEFNSLLLETNNSVIKDHLVLRFDDFADMNNFISNVKMEARLRGSELDSDDIAFFAPQIKSWNRKIRISGDVRGSVSDLKLEDLVIQAGGSTYFAGNASLFGLPDIDLTFIDLRADDFRTTYADALTYFPDLRRVSQPALHKLKYIRFNGSFTGFIRDFVTYGTIETALGTVSSDLNMKLPNGATPVYSGTIATQNFQLGTFLENNMIGNIAFEGDLRGRGFQWNSLMVDIDGKIKHFEFNDYRYRNIITKGKLNKQLFDGYFQINDSNAVMTLNGIVDLNGQTPKFNFLADVEELNLQPLKLTNDNLSFNGKFNLNFTGSNIDNFSGVARISDGSLLKDGIPLSFDSLYLASSYEGGIKTLRAISNEFDATVTGDFLLQELPQTVTLFLNKYYPAYIRQPAIRPGPQAFSFDIKTGLVEEYIQLINKNLTGFNNSHIRGSLNTSNNQLTLEADIPRFAFQKYVFNNARIKASGDLEKLTLIGDLDNVIIADSLNLPQTHFEVVAQNDISNIIIATSANQGINDARVAAQVQTFSDGVKITFQPTTFVLNGKTWTIHENGVLQFRTSSVATGELLLTESNQEIRINTVPSDIGDWNDLQVKITKLNLGDLSPFLLKKNRLEGLISGNIFVEDPAGRMSIEGDVLTDQLRLDDDSIGQVQANISYNNTTGELKGRGYNLDPNHKINFDLNLFFKDSLRFKDNRITANLQSFQLNILERFLGDLFSDIQGYVTGNLAVTGPFNELTFTGKGRLEDAGLRVNFSQVYYKLDDADIELKPTEVNLGTLKMTDRFGKTATLNGSIQHNSWKNMFFDITARVDNQPMELLNTTVKNNELFFGRAKGTGSFALIGPQADMFMKIDAMASQQDSSYITIRSTETRESGRADFLVERKYGREMTEEDVKTNLSKITYDVDMTANNMVNVKFILDDLTGDEINGRGEGNLNIRAGTFEPLTMRGRFDIEQGDYTFTFQSFFKKPFVLRPGAGNYISWSGDPLAATVRLTAQYTAEDVSFAPLANSLGLNTSLSRVRGDVFVVATLTEDLFRPVIDFRLEFPPNSVAITDPSLSFSIQQIVKNQNELYKQASYLIVFNSFANVESIQNTGGGSFGTALNEFAYSTLSGIFFNEINKQLNSILTKIFKNDENLTFTLSGSLYNRNLIDRNANNSFNINQGNFNFTVGRSFFNDRFLLTFGSGFDVPLANSAQYNFQFLPDVTAEWLINKSGSVRATFFYRENLDYLTTSVSSRTTKRAGVSIAYRKEFDSLDELLTKKKREAQAEIRNLPAPPVSGTNGNDE
ncbi:MAG: translocation/assembly module TamB domain-containing protein [Chitinophagaceae bacterium]|nr:translocation/assembly module TamB domain-containing protein [Chitinophagaceae bacterium]